MPTPLTFAIAPLQAAVQARLKAHPWLADIPILTEAQGDVPNEIDRAMGALTGVDGKIGACVVILTPAASSKFPNSPGPLLDQLDITLSVLENVMVNQSDQGTKKHALEIVEFLLRFLHHWACANAVLCVRSPAYNLVTGDPLTYHVNFQTKLALKPESE